MLYIRVGEQDLSQVKTSSPINASAFDPRIQSIVMAPGRSEWSSLVTYDHHRHEKDWIHALSESHPWLKHALLSKIGDSLTRENRRIEWEYQRNRILGELNHSKGTSRYQVTHLGTKKMHHIREHFLKKTHLGKFSLHKRNLKRNEFAFTKEPVHLQKKNRKAT